MLQLQLSSDQTILEYHQKISIEPAGACTRSEYKLR